MTSNKKSENINSSNDNTNNDDTINNVDNEKEEEEINFSEKQTIENPESCFWKCNLITYFTFRL